MNATLRLRMLPRFPARITGADGITVVRETGSSDLIAKPAYDQLGDVGAIPDPATNYFMMWDSETDTYVRIPFQGMFDSAGIAAVYPTVSAAEVANIPVSVHAIEVYGDATVGDGNGGLYIDTDNDSATTFLSGDGRTWYKVEDIGIDRLKDAGAAGKAILATELVADTRNFLDTAPYVATRAALKALDTSKDTTAILTEAGREGIFNCERPVNSFSGG